MEVIKESSVTIIPTEFNYRNRQLLLLTDKLNADK